MHFNTITSHRKRLTIGPSVPRDTAVTKRFSRFSFRYKLPSPSRLWVHLPLSCTQHFLPLAPYRAPPSSKSAPSGRGSLWYLYPSFLALFFFLLLSLPPTVLPAPSPACSRLRAAVLKWVTNAAIEAQAASRFVQSSGLSTLGTFTVVLRHCGTHVHVCLPRPPQCDFYMPLCIADTVLSW